jgi:hypothetical protein
MIMLKFGNGTQIFRKFNLNIIVNIQAPTPPGKVKMKSKKKRQSVGDSKSPALKESFSSISTDIYVESLTFKVCIKSDESMKDHLPLNVELFIH